MKYGLVIAAAAALFCGSANAETQAAERGRKLVDDMIAGLGGDKFLNMQDRIEEGRVYSFYRERLTGLSVAKIYTRYLPAPPKEGDVAQAERHEYGKDIDYLNLFMPDKAYQVTYRGAKPLADERWERYVDSTRKNIFYILRQRLKEPGLIFEHRGSQVWQNTPVEVMDITDADNNVITLYVNAHTKLPLRQHYVRRDPKTKERDEYTSIFAKYRDAGEGVQWPFNMLTERNGEKVFEIFSESVKINQSLPDSLFALSPGTKILPADK
jgi:hypothetical protein